MAESPFEKKGFIRPLLAKKTRSRGTKSEPPEAWLDEKTTCLMAWS